MDEKSIDTLLQTGLALAAGWLVKSFFSASRKEVEVIKDQMHHLVSTSDLDTEIEKLEKRLDRIEHKIDNIGK
jgi:cell shape-determining protein MreC